MSAWAPRDVSVLLPKWKWAACACACTWNSKGNRGVGILLQVKGCMGTTGSVVIGGAAERGSFDGTWAV
eukprot:scaffold124261_cov46-Tisochrysis_lutea.AAC.2